MEDFKHLIKSSKFKYLWASQILSQLTINIIFFLLFIRLFEYTGSSIATSLLWIAYALPAIIVGPFAAALVDMADRRSILIVTNFLQAATIFLYAFIHENRLFLPYGVILTYSFVNQFNDPAEAASLPSLVKKKNLPHANSLFFLTQQGGLIVGFGIAGMLKHLLGFGNALFLCSGLLFLASISVSFLPSMGTKKLFRRGFEEEVMKFFARIVEGYKFIKENRSILLPFVLMLGLSVSLSVVAVNLPALATEIFKINIDSAGLLIILPAGTGAAVGAILISKFLKEGWRKKKAIETFLMIMTFLLFVFTFVLPELPHYGRILVGIITVFLIGLSFTGIFIPSQTFLQEKTPGGLRGRVFGNYWFLVTVATVFPVFLSGAITEMFGIRFLTFLLTGISLVALVFSNKYGQEVLNNEFSFRKK